MPSPASPLKRELLDIIRRSGPITFERYMALCLYDQEHGYYMQGRERTGVRGDYFTSPDLHPIFARLVARQAAQMWEILGCPSSFAWVEMGAGRGWFARDFLEWVRRAREDFEAALDYWIVEPSGPQRAVLLRRVAESEVALVNPVSALRVGHRPRPDVRAVASLDELEPVVGCFFSNELIDAFPVSVVTRSGGRLREVYVTAQGDVLREILGPISDPALAAYVARYAGQLDEGGRVEVNLNAQRWIRSVGEKLSRGFVITIDYGDLAQRLYSPARPQGTLLAYTGHMASGDVLNVPGEQDMTSHVNFSALIDEGKKAGLEFTGLVPQEHLLLAVGEGDEFTDLYEPVQTERERLEARLRLKRLLFGEGMGSIFKVLIQHRGVVNPDLVGLRFGRNSNEQAFPN